MFGRKVVKNLKTVREIEMPKIGMRMLKSAVAVFICFLFSFLREDKNAPFYAVIAAILCMQPYVENSKKVAFNRIIGTFIGAFYGVIVLSVERNYIPANMVLLEYLLVSMAIIPTIYTTLLLKKPTASYIACVVLMSVAVTHGADVYPVQFVLKRVLETLMGILVALVVNMARLPRKKNREILFVTGVDGTLLNKNGCLEPFSKVELNRLIQEGASITIASEQTPASLLVAMEGINFRLPIIAMDGAVLYDIKEKQYLDCRSLSLETTEQVKDVFREMGLNCFINVLIQDVLLIYHGDFKNSIEKQMYRELRRSPYRNYVYGELPKGQEAIYFLSVAQEEVADELERRLRTLDCREELLFLRDTSETPPGYCHLKIYHKEATKQYMVERLKERLHMTHTVAFGSNKNDVSMLASADYSFAMHDATADVKRISDFIMNKREGLAAVKLMKRIYEPLIWQKNLEKKGKGVSI